MSTPCDTPTLLYHDEYLVAMNKPPGLLVHRSALAAEASQFALQWLRHHLKRMVYPVHRLDRGTSGVLLMALDPDTARALARQFEAQQVRKTYLALVRGWPATCGEVDHPLRRLDEAAPRIDRGRSTDAQPALTRYQRLARLECASPLPPHPTARYALMAVEPQTGRQHQIRRHFKHISHPLIGDATYGKGDHNRWWAARLGVSRLWLHAARLRLHHPVSGTPLTLQAPAGPAWATLLAEPGWQIEHPDALHELLGGALAAHTRPSISSASA
ncbi:pseudouridine synthase [Caldimonas manganoxidans]|uniref:pseudouridine synthase n=1 Tax=Caldimonas manganoxidans TaxID=196015 RepID=UPI00036562BC|nr:pseudouridine synthase [Caldimonas manganoxidans]